MAVKKKKAEDTKIVAVVPDPRSAVAIRIDDIEPSPFNGRRYNPDTITELARSIAVNGLLSPIMVRPVANDNGGPGYQVVFGHRRLKAASRIWMEIPAFVQELTDDEAMELTITENLQREDLGPLEEAASIQRLIDTGRNVAEIADHLGKPLSWVVKRARLTRLTDSWKKAVMDTEGDFSAWTVSHFEIISRYPEKTQEKLLEEFHNRYNGPGYMTVKDVRSACESKEYMLTDVPWKLDDADLLPEAGSCMACEKRRGFLPMLFDEMKITGKNDQCLDVTCWKMKRAAVVQKDVMAASEKHPGVMIFDSHGFFRNVPEDWPVKSLTMIDNYWESDVANKSDKDAFPVLFIDYEGKIRLKWRKHGKRAGEKRAVDENGKLVPLTLAQRRAKHQKKRDRLLVEQILEIVEKEIEEPDLIDKQDDNAKLALVYGVLKHKSRYLSDSDYVKTYREALVGLEAGKIHEVMTEFVRLAISIDFKERIGLQLNKTLDDLDAMFTKHLAGMFGIDLKPLEEAIEKETPEPKSWAKLNEDGTPKTKK